MKYVKGEKYPGCILCSIVEKRDDVVNLCIWEDEDFLVSVNLYPYNPGHLFIFPRRHLTDIRELTGEQEAKLDRITRSCLNLLDAVYAPSGYNIGYNMGLTAGASIDHIHRHIIPRYPRETGIADLLAGKRVLVESPEVSCERLKKALSGLTTPFA
ncbi:HIT family protein [Sediminispirochaeta bajacaliforniensis]|uniref:HIT family protein n=1 Tax=Sediminispirochaeta bajacaliforniensis TaxID=148 RepID=UPI001FE04DE0|nr:HIT domain-containing protein [Sediminispirochaeta bajacaliforniensis]